MLSNFRDALANLYDKLPRWVRVAFWIAVAGAVTNVLAAVTNGTVKVDAIWLAIINIVLVAIKDFANKKSEE